MKNVKLRVNNYEHAKAINKRAEELGSEPLEDKLLKKAEYLYLHATALTYTCGDERYFKKHRFKEVTLDELYDDDFTFTTEDGVELRLGDRVFMIDTDNNNRFYRRVVRKYTGVNKSLKYFSSKEKAEEYLEDIELKEKAHYYLNEDLDFDTYEKLKDDVEDEDIEHEKLVDIFFKFSKYLKKIKLIFV